jgi:hypothetical protein
LDVAEKPAPAPDYRPTPLDTSSVELDPHLLHLTEQLAEHTHDLWAQLRLAQGWTWGPARDDHQKQHPCLVPYRDLPEAEKDHDRATALGTIRALLALGHTLTPPSAVAARAAEVSRHEVARLERELRDATLGLNALEKVWQAHSPIEWAPYPQLFITLGSRLAKCDSPFLAFEVLAEGLASHPGHLRLRQLAAHALARAGSTSEANRRLQALVDEGHRDAESLSLLARTHKDLALAAGSRDDRRHHLSRAFDLYHDAFARSGESYPGINAATLALLLGEVRSARSLARRSAAAARKELRKLKRNSPDRYWLTATLAEAALLLNQKNAVPRYNELVALAGERLADLASTRRNARMILDAGGNPGIRIEDLMPSPGVVVFTGHMVDQPDRPAPRFPAAAAGAVAAAIEARLEALGARIGYASAARGGDILFLEAMRRRGGSTNVVLPYPESDFIGSSVLLDQDDGWVPRFDAALLHAESVRRAVGQRFADSAVFFEYTNLLLLGLARLRSARLDVELIPMALWDGKPGDGAAGTASTVEEWRSQGFKVEVIDLAAIVPAAPAAPREVGRPAPPPPAGLETSIMAVLFADVVNFSKLTEAEIPRFVEHFLGSVGKMVRQSPHAPVVSNTWGDGLYFVFRTVADAGAWALELTEMAARTDWSARGLRKDLNLRVALHAGPLFTVIDPVTNQKNHTGKQVVPAARLEPVTPPGLVYASEEFAAIAAATRVTSFTCEPVGKLGLAKGAGSIQVYHVRRVKSEG